MTQKVLLKSILRNQKRIKILIHQSKLKTDVTLNNIGFFVFKKMKIIFFN